MLTQLETQPASTKASDKAYNELRLKVLRYLIARYADERCWNRRSAASQSQSTSRSHAASRLLPTVCNSLPPRQSRDLMPSLRRIREANVDSYQDFGVAVN